jgi:hypothetical protein
MSLRSTADQPTRQAKETSLSPLPLFEFPREIRLQILEQLLTCEEHLTFIPVQGNASTSLRLGRFHRREEVELEPVALVSSFSAVCRASQQLRSEAQYVFFSRNTWILHVTVPTDAISWVLGHWGEVALQTMAFVRIEAEGSARLVRKALGKFVDALRTKKRLQKLCVRWVFSSRHFPLIGRNPHFWPLTKDFRFERRADGTRGSKREMVAEGEEMGTNPYSGYVGGARQVWVKKEKALTPLQRLKGIHGIIEGCVTDEWALWLEQSMAAPEQPIGKFVRFKDVKEAEKEMTEAIQKETDWYNNWLIQVTP